MKTLLATFLALLLALPVDSAVARTVITIINYENRPIAAAARPRADHDVRQAILNALRQRQWTLSEESPGRMLVQQSWNHKHTMTIEISHTATSFSLRYHSSINLNYFAYGKNGPEIHPAYNERVKSLLETIEAELNRP